MGYSVKWVNENLGITRDMLRYYEKEGLLSKEDTQNKANKYRNYSDEDIEKIWGIKLLIEIGFSAKEIYAFMNIKDFDFDAAIAQKVKELEKKHSERAVYLEFAKSIKLMGKIPTTSKIGNVNFEDFLVYALENWNFHDDPHMTSFMHFSDTMISKEPQQWKSDEVEQILELFKDFDAERMMYIYSLHGYWQVIADMREFGYSSDIVQRVIRLLHEYLVKHNVEPELDDKITPQFLAKHIAPFFLSGDAAIMYEKNYGKEGCLFIAQALACYGGYKIEEL